MILDSEKQRELLTQCVNAINVSGADAEVIAALKRSLREADVEPPENGDPVAEAVERAAQEKPQRGLGAG